MLVSIWLLFGLLALSSSTNVPSQVLELNDKFLEVMNEGLWLVEVTSFSSLVFASRSPISSFSSTPRGAVTASAWRLFGNKSLTPSPTRTATFASPKSTARVSPPSRRLSTFTDFPPSSCKLIAFFKAYLSLSNWFRGFAFNSSTNDMIVRYLMMLINVKKLDFSVLFSDWKRSVILIINSYLHVLKFYFVDDLVYWLHFAFV